MTLYSVRVTPKAREDSVEDVGNNHYVIRVRAVPEKGKANEQVIKLLSVALGVAQARLSVVRGLKSRDKKILYK